MITITDDCAQTSALHAPILPFHVTPAAPVLPPARSCHPCPSLPFAVACLFVVTLQNQLQDIAPPPHSKDNVPPCNIATFLLPFWSEFAGLLEFLHSFSAWSPWLRRGHCSRRRGAQPAPP